MINETDAMLVARFRKGDLQALEALFGRYLEALHLFLVNLLRDHHQAEDVLQETFLRALEHLDNVDPDHVRGWLFKVAHQQALLSLRRRKGKATGSLDVSNGMPTQEPGPLELCESQDDCVRLQQLLERLPASQREVIHQRIYEGKRFREIADDLRCPLNTALARMHEGLKKLRHLWDSDAP